MKIRISLPDDRDFAGRLEVLDARGAVIFGPVPAAGRAHDQRAVAHGNAARNRLRPYGDTPLGAYAVRGVCGGGSMVLLEPASGEAALADAHGRLRFCVQGGDDHLRAIDGNISLCERHQKELVALVQSAAGEWECEIVATVEQGERIVLGRPPVDHGALDPIGRDQAHPPRRFVVAETSGAGGGATTYSGGGAGAGGTGAQSGQSGPDDTTVGPLPTTGTDVAPRPGVDLNVTPGLSIVKFYQIPPTAQIFPAATQTGFTPVLNVNTGWLTFSFGTSWSDPYGNTPGGGPNAPYTGSSTGPYSNIQPDNLNPNQYTGGVPIEPYSNTDSPGAGTGTQTQAAPTGGQQRDSTDNQDSQIQDMVRIFAQQDAQLLQQQQQAQQQQAQQQQVQQQQVQQQQAPPQTPPTPGVVTPPPTVAQATTSGQASQGPLPSAGSAAQSGQQSGAASPPNFPDDTGGPAAIVGTVTSRAYLPPGGITTGVQPFPDALPPPVAPPPATLPPPRVESAGAWVRASPSQAAQAAIEQQIAMGFLPPELLGKNISTGTAQTEGSISRGIRGQTAEISAYDARLSQGQVGILAPKGVTRSGLDYATASRLPNGDWQINIGDTASRYTSNSFKTSPGAAKASWLAELSDAFSYKPGGPRTGSFSLPNDPVTEQAIRDAYNAGRISNVQIDTVDFSAQGRGEMTINGRVVAYSDAPSARAAAADTGNPSLRAPVGETGSPAAGGAAMGAAVSTVFTALDILMNPDAHPDAARELFTTGLLGAASGGTGAVISSEVSSALTPALAGGESSFFGEVVGGGAGGGPAAALFTLGSMALDDNEYTATDYEAKGARSFVDGTVSGLAGVAAAETIGATLGTFIPIPGVGTAVGFVAGYAAYKVADWLFGDSVEDAVRGEPEGEKGDFEIAQDPSGFLTG